MEVHLLIYFRVDLPSLTQVLGAFNLQSSEEFDCAKFDDAKKEKKIIKGEYVCEGSQTKPGTAGTKPSSTSASGKSAASPLDLKVSLVMGSFSLVATVLQLLL